MKKLILFLVATLFSALSFAALNPYAYALSSTLDGNTLKVNYSLNAPATAVSVVIMDGETEVKTVTCDGKTEGSHTVEISTLDLPTGKSLTWKVNVTGAAVTKATAVSTYRFYHPSSVDIDNNPESAHFGRLLCIEASHSIKTASRDNTFLAKGFGAGIFAFNAAFKPIKNGELAGFNGGNTFTTTHYAVRRVRISDDGRIFVTAQNDGGCFLWEVDPDNLNSWTKVFQGTEDAYTTTTSDGKFIAGTNSGFDVHGSGENLKLVMLSAGQSGANVSTFRCDEYDLGTKTEWSTIPSRSLNKGYHYVTNQSNVQYDAEGGIWHIQYRGNVEETHPGLVHINKDGVEDFKEYWTNARNAGFCFNKDYSKVIIAGKFNDSHVGTQKYATIYTVSKNSEGKPTLTKELEIDMTNIGAALNDFAWDWADNIYAVDNSGEYLCAYALPHTADKVVSTPCASKDAFELEEVVANVYTLTTNVVGEGTIEGNNGSYVEGTTATLTATPAEHYDFVNWTYGSETSTANPLTITVNSDMTVTANFQEHTKYTITAHAADNTMGYVTGGKAYYAGETVTLKAVANSTYYFVNWSDGVTDAIRTFTATKDVTLTANFAKATPRAWAYDLKVVEDGDNYKFTFNATTAGNATLLFADKEGNELYTAHEVGAVAAGANTVSIEKAYFTQVKDVYWSVKMDGEAITAVAEITDQTRGIYDFYNMQGVVVDNDPNSEKFGEIYIEMAKSGTTNSKAQTLGLFLLNQNLDLLNTDPNVGIQPTMPSGYALNGTNYTFQRLNIHPKTGDLVFSYGIASKPAVFAIDRENMTGSVTNLLDGITGLTKTVAHCFDEDGALYVMDIVSYKGTIYKIKDGVKSTFSAATGKYAADNITMASDGRGGLWVAQNRGQIDACYQLAHVNSEGFTDWSIYDDQGGGTSSTGFTGYSTRGALAYDAERHILAQGRNSTVEVFQVAYDATTGVPTLTKIATTPQVNKANIDGLAFDYAGDLYMVNSGTEKFYKYTLPTAENICTVPAPESQKIVKEVRWTVTINVVGNGEVEGAGEYIEGTSVALTATPAEHHRFIGWTGDKTSMDNPLEFVAESNITLTATFEAIPQYTITVSANDGEMGSVTGGGTYDEGSTATLTATPVGGYVFEKWSDDNTDNPRTITVNGAAAYTAIFKVAPARVFAYNLDVVENGDDTYTLSFIPNANATSGRVILYNDDTKAQIHEAPIAGTIAKGVKSEVVISKSVMPAAGIVTWAVELTGEQVEKLTLLTKANDKANYGFNRPQGVAIDNNPASDFFGRIYIALPKAGGTGYSDTNYGIVVMDPLHNRLKSGIVSHNDALGSNGRYSMHRVAVNPTNGHVYYVRTSDSNEGVTGTAIYELTPDATNILTDGGTAKNVISGASDITNANSVCFDETGAMYVMANANYDNTLGSTGRVYKVIDGVATLFTPSSIEIASKDNAIVPDGKGGFWVAQHRNSLDGSNHLFHINTSGATDYYIDQNNNASLLPIQTYTKSGTTYKNASYRGQVAYYSIDENNGLVAYGGGAKVSVFKATYDGSGVPTLSTWQTISLLSQSSTEGIHVDGIAFDYAGNIIVMSATDERMYQYALPIESANTSLVPSPTSKAIKLGTIYNVEVTVNDPAMGTATGGGEYIAGETATLEATPAANHNFVNWTYGSETSTNNPLELVVEGNITVTANFEPVQYTLITPTNDENKGTVAGAGTYAHGTEVTLTANPAAGYKLLYWSDRSTENPRTITMNKDEAISAYFVKEYDVEPTFKIEKVWENTQVPGSADGYQAVGWDGNIYMQNKTAGKIKVYSNDTDAAVDYATSNTFGQQIAVDEAGNLIVFNATFYSINPNAIQIYKKGSTTAKAISFTLPHPERCDFISASGDIYSAEGGYVYFYCQNKNAVNRVKITNGALASVDAIGNTEKPATSVSHVMVDIFGNLAAHCRSTAVYAINSYTGETTAFTTTLSGVKLSTLGGCTFELGGKELWAYNVGTTNYNSEWNLYNMTDKVFMSNETLYAKDKDSRKTTGPANWLNVQVVNENTAYIYQFCPKVAAAVWKVSIQRDDLQEYTVTATANDASMGSVTGGGTYYEGATAILTATANSGYRFVNWTKAGEEVSTYATYTFTVTEDVELVANFEEIPAPRAITYELNGGQYNQYGWENKGDICLALEADYNATYGTSKNWVQKVDGVILYNINGTWMTEEEAKGQVATVVGFIQNVTFNEANNLTTLIESTMVDKYGWLKDVFEANRDAQGLTTTWSENLYRKELSAFFLHSPAHTGWPTSSSYEEIGELITFQTYWTQKFPNPTHPNSTVTLNAPYKEGYLFDGWYAASDFSGAEITVVDETTNGTLYAKWREHRYTRNDVTNGNYGTICLPYGSSSYSGAEFYEIAYLEFQADGVTPKGIWLDEVTGALEAGKPYIFKATSTLLIVNYEGDAELNPVAGEAGLTGTFNDITDESVLKGNYMIADNKFWLCGTGCWLNANRAYIEHDALHATTTPVSPIPGRRRVMMGAAGENTTTGVDNLTEDGVVSTNQATKMVVNGQLIIIRDGVKYNAQGVRL